MTVDHISRDVSAMNASGTVTTMMARRASRRSQRCGSVT
jgi:hypothetical protein